MASKLNSFISFFTFNCLLLLNSQKYTMQANVFFFYFLSVYTHDIEQKTHTHVRLTGVMCNIRKALQTSTRDFIIWYTRVCAREKFLELDGGIKRINDITSQYVIFKRRAMPGFWCVSENSSLEEMYSWVPCGMLSLKM